MLAAFDKICITPPLGGTWPDAFFDLRKGTLDDLYVRLLWVAEEDGGAAALMISVDALMVGLPELDRLEAAVASATGLPVDAIWVMVSHSHSAPILGAIDDYTGLGPYWKELCAQVVASTRQLRERALPARLTRGTGTCDFNVNRRLISDDGSCIMRPNLDGVCDKRVPVLAFRGEQGELLGLCYSFCCHPTILLGPLASGDYPGQTSIALEAEHDCVALYMPGTFGNVRPHIVDEEGAFRTCVPEDAARCAVQLQAAVNDGLSLASPCAATEISAHRLRHALPLGSLPTTEEIDTLLADQWRDNKDLPHWTVHQQAGVRRWAQAVEGARDNPPLSSTFRFSYLAIGPVELVGMSGEFFLEYGMKAQEIFGADTIALGYTHGCQSYVPTDRALSEGGYEPGAWKRFGQLAPFAPGVEASVGEALERLHEATARHRGA
jgi:neutral ceramidase